MRPVSLIGLVVMVTACASVAVSPADEEVRTYEGYKVVRIRVKSQDWATLESVMANHNDEDVDIWRQSRTAGEMDVGIHPRHFRSLANDLSRLQFTFDVMEENVGRVIRHQNEASRRRRKRSVHVTRHHDVMTYFPRYEEILFWMEETVRHFKGLANIIDIGTTAEGRRMRVLRIGLPGEHKWKMWLDGGIHGREWIAPTTVMYTAGQLLKGYTEGDNATINFLQSLDWYFLPVVNPDGYEFTHVKNRLWRKNRNPQNQNCTGVDLNRNWGFQWGGAASSLDPCSNVYQGSSPEVEPEVENIVNFLLPRSDSFIGYVTYHSYGQRFTTRWDYTDSIVPQDHKQLLTVAEQAVEAMGSVYGVQYDAGRAPELMYAYGGGSPDWARAIANIKYSYLIELRDRTTFLLPPHEIIPTGHENWAGLQVVVKDILDYYGDIPAPNRRDPAYIPIARDGYKLIAESVSFNEAVPCFSCFNLTLLFVQCLLFLLLR